MRHFNVASPDLVATKSGTKCLISNSWTYKMPLFYMC